ncbi:MAG: hypothetical protein JWM82_2866 [Myxococcales bacterium]|nr:hypothetical protein [Myxococcales bacterium]
MQSPASLMCAYHRALSSDFAEAHVFPNALGGVTSSDRTLCKACNHEVNSRVENPSLDFFSFYRSAWRIGSRRQKIPPVAGEVRFADGRSFPVTLGPDGEVRRAIVQAEKMSDGRRSYFVVGTPERIARERAQIDSRRPGLRWEGGEVDHPCAILVDLDMDADKPLLRRLAAKVAFERACMLRGGDFMAGPEFDAVRAFILEGVEPRMVCGLIGDEAAYRDPGPVSFGLGRHAVIVTTQQNVFGAVVVFFGLFYYWVTLARPYGVLAQWDDVLIENPQSGEVTSPIFRSARGALQFPWDLWHGASTKTPGEVSKAVAERAMRRLEKGTDDFYGAG